MNSEALAAAWTKIQDNILFYIMEVEPSGEIGSNGKAVMQATDRDISGDVKDIKVDAGVETSPGQKRLHLHALIQVVHTTRIHIDVELIKGKLYELIPELIPGKLWVGVKMSTGANYILDYIRKYNNELEDLTYEELATAYKDMIKTERGL